MVEQVFTANGKFQGWEWLPTEAGIQGVIAGNVEARQLIHISNTQILLEMLGQVYGGSEIELMFRACAVRIVGSRIQTVAIFVDVHLQIGVRTEESPFGQDSPIRERLYAIRPPAHLVGGHEGHNQISRDWISFHERCARFRCPQVGIVVIERGNIGGEGAGCLNAVPEFICEKVFGLELTAAENRFYHRQRAVERRHPSGNDGFIQPNTLFGQRRSPDGARNRGPDGLVFADDPQESYVGLYFKAREIIMLELGTNGYAQQLMKKTYLILHEGTELVQAAMIWLEGNGKAGAVSILNGAVTQPPYKLLRLTDVEIVLKINVVYGFVVDEQAIVGDVCSVIVHLQGHRGALKGMIPAAQEIPSAICPGIGQCA